MMSEINYDKIEELNSAFSEKLDTIAYFIDKEMKAIRSVDRTELKDLLLKYHDESMNSIAMLRYLMEEYTNLQGALKQTSLTKASDLPLQEPNTEEVNKLRDMLTTFTYDIDLDDKSYLLMIDPINRHVKRV